jgi:hypothetical protein
VARCRSLCQIRAVGQHPGRPLGTSPMSNALGFRCYPAGVDSHWFDRIYLEPEQTSLLSWMIETERDLPREQQVGFSLVNALQSYFLLHPFITERPVVRPGDLDSLAEVRLLRRKYQRKSRGYEVTPLGRRYYGHLKILSGEPAERTPAEIKQYMVSDAFQSIYVAAYERWTHAESELWVAENEAQFTRIGHTCREALQSFADILARSTVLSQSIPSDPAKTVIRIRAVLELSFPPDRLRAFLEALLKYWQAVSDIVQRQEHGAAKLGDPITWEDTRRVVFQTMIVMYEIDRAIKNKG